MASDSIMDGNRWTSKFVKFNLPDILSGYDIVIWCDSKTLRKELNINTDTIIKLFADNNYKLFNVKHPERTTLQEELNVTIENSVENRENGIRFRDEIGDRLYKTNLVDSMLIIRKTDKETNDLFTHVFNLLREKGLKRDQNIYNHAIDEINYSPEYIYIFDGAAYGIPSIFLNN